MAIVIHQQPQTITPAYNDSWILAYSTQYLQPNFKYIVEVTINGKTIRRDIAPRLDGGVLFNVKEIAANFIQRPFDFDSAGRYNLTNNTVVASIAIKEFYSNAVQAAETISKTFTDSCYTESYFKNDYEFRNVFNNDVANIFNVDSRVTLDTDIWFKTLDFYGDTFYKLDNISVELNGNLVGTVSIGSDTNMINLGVRMVNDLSSIPVQVGDNVLIEFNSDEPTTVNTTGYVVTSLCSKYPNKRVYFYDRAGQIKYFNFDLASTQNITKATNSVRLNRNRVTTGSPLNSYGYNNWDRESHIVSTETTKQITLNSNWITETQSINLVDLFDGPLVWLFEDSIYKPVTIKDTSYTVKSHKVDKLFNHTIVCEYSETETRQRGI
jgi:hypothetical protein